MIETIRRRLEASSLSNEEVGYHQNWYPICLSSEIEPGTLKGVDFLNSRVVAYRDSDGKAIVQSAYCRHLGADLSEGDLVDGCVRCPFHHWQYDSSGTCVKIPSGDKIPPAAKIFNYPTAETYGIVWAFNGETPLFAPPSLHDINEADTIFDAREFDVLPVEPWLPISNSFDIQHLGALHGLKMSEPTNVDMGEYGFDYDIEAEGPGIMGVAQQHIRVNGTNVFILCNKMAGTVMYSITGFRQTPSGNSVNYLISAVPKPPENDPMAQQMVEQMIGMNIAFAKQLTDDDRRVLTTIRFKEGLLVESDRRLAQFFKYVRGFPRANPVAAYL